MSEKININPEKTNLEINYEEFLAGKENDTIVILHGWGGSSQSWLTVGELLKQNSFNVIIPDLPGFGKTKLKYIFDLDEYAKVTEGFIKQLGLKNIILWGHSNGGVISIKIASRGKIDISRLVLNNSAGIRNDKKRTLKRKALGYVVKNFSFLKKIFIFKKLRILFYKLIGGRDYLNSEKNPHLKGTYLNMIKSDLSEIIPKIKQNTLLIWGEKDTYTPLSDGKFMRDNIKSSKMIVLDNEKHGIHIQNPERLVETFINNI